VAKLHGGLKCAEITRVQSAGADIPILQIAREAVMTPFRDAIAEKKGSRAVKIGVVQREYGNGVLAEIKELRRLGEEEPCLAEVFGSEARLGPSLLQKPLPEAFVQLHTDHHSVQ